MNKALISACVLASMVIIVSTQDDVNECPFHKAFCEAIRTPEGHDKYLKCFDEKSPQFMKEMGDNCKKQVGEEATSTKDLWEKICDKSQKELAKKLNLCMKEEFGKKMEEDPNCLDKMEGFMTCIAP